MKSAVIRLIVRTGMFGFGLVSLSAARTAQGQAAAYLKFGIDARILGLGGAGTAVSNDVNATYWNPAGLADVVQREAAAMHTSLSLDRNYNYLGYATPIKKKGWVLGGCLSSLQRRWYSRNPHPFQSGCGRQWTLR